MSSKRIPIRNRDGKIVKWTTVSCEDYPRLSRFKWYLRPAGVGSSKFYAQRTDRSCGRAVSVGMHREVLGLSPGDGLEVDHINGKTLDNRRENLRATNRFGNCQNLQGPLRSRKRRLPLNVLKLYKTRRGYSWGVTIIRNGQRHSVVVPSLREAKAAAVRMRAALSAAKETA